MNVQDIEFRRVHTPEEYKACEALQRHIWGEGFTECVPPSIMMVSQKIGGVTAGTFAGDGTLLGFVFGMTGLKESRPMHWSHMLGVRREVRGQGLGRRLKLYQRDLLLESGVELVCWTYDPLVAYNAHLNINRLGADIAEYVRNMYGDLGSELHRGVGTDRFIVEWHIAEERVEKIVAGEVKPNAARIVRADTVNTYQKDGTFGFLDPKDAQNSPIISIEIPRDIQAVQKESLELAAQWRSSTQKAFIRYFEHGYRIKAFYCHQESERCFYGLEREGELITIQ